MVNELNTDIKGHKTSPADEREHEIPLFARRVVEVPSNMQMRAEYNASNNPTYVGYGIKGLASNAVGWLLHKITYDANQNPTLRQVAYGDWDNRASESYE